MKTMLKSVMSALGASLFGWTLSAADTWHVNAANYNESYADAAAYIAAGCDGSEAAKGFGTIQIAIDKAKSGDTIYVEPGVYSNGTKVAVSNWGLSRIGWSNKKLFIYSTGNSSNTYIVGMKSEESEIGIGSDAVRCVAVYGYNGQSDGSIIKGFTFLDGATASASNGNDNYRRGGGACVSSANIYFEECVFTGCSAYTGGAAYGGTFARCFFTQNSVSSLYAVYGSLSAKVRLYACVLHHNAYGTANDNSGGTMFSYITAVNCTIIDNLFKACCGSANESFYNTICYNSGTYAAASTFANCVKESDEQWPVMSTIIPDVRLLPNSAALTAGNGENLSRIPLPDGIDYRDFGGNVPAASGVIAAGATQTVGTPAAGGIAVKGGVICVNDTGLCRKDSYSYVFPDAYPTQYLFSAVAPEGKRLSHFHFYGHSAATYDYRFPDRGDRLWVMPPADPNVVITNYETVIRDVTYVKPDADASVADGSAEHPYRTLQAAFDAKPETVIVAKAGIYAEGGTNDTTYGKSRLQTSKVTRITSEEGAEHTIIMGESDTSPDADDVGCGPNAVRCVAHASNMAQIQGFTLTGGRTARTSTRTGQGGAAWSANGYLYVDDCIVTNNYANANGIAFNTRLTRCYVAKNNNGRDCIVYGGAGCASVFYVDGNNAPSTGVFGGSVRMYHCTVVGEKISGLNPYSASNNDIKRYASVFLGGDTAGDNGTSVGNIVWDYLYSSDTAASVLDPLLANPATGDAHPFASSPVFLVGVMPTSANYGSEYWYYASSDYEGNPIVFNVGKPTVGALMKPTTRRIVAVLAENGGISPSATRVELAADETYTLTLADGTRPIAGVTVDGVTNVATSAGWSITLPGADAVGGMTVLALYSNVWYAAPNGNDSASGFFPDTAKSLQGALTNANLAVGDRVVALPGTYRTGKMIQSGTYDVYSRAVVPENVTLESRDGKAATIIEGEQATTKDDPPSGTTTYDVRGLGADAVRCVLLQNGASLKGFTLTNGWTRATKGGTANHSDPDTCGGGVWCAGVECRVEDCIIAGNGAYRGAGAFNGFCLNCEFADNYAYYGGGGSSNCRNHGCFSHGNTAASWSVNSGIFAVRDAVNCTCHDSLAQSVSAAAFLGVTNTVVTGIFFPNNMAAEKVSHSVFNVDSLNNVPEGYFVNAEASFATNVMALAFDERGRPEIGKNCCVDAGTANVPDTLEATDLLGDQRVYNGRLDIGAVEADWRERYGRDICSRLSVQFAASQVVEMPDKTVRVPEGASLNATLQRKSEPTYRAKFVFRVSSGGVARLTVDGVETILQEGTHDFTMSAGDSPLPIDITAESGFVDVLRAQSLIGCIISVF